MKISRTGFIATSLALAAGLICNAAQAQSGATWPSKPVRLVVTFPPGGSSDAAARIVAPKLAERLGQPVIVDNKPGGGGGVGLDIVAKSPADGYTIVLASAGGLTANPSLYPKLTYDPVRDFAPITLFGTSPFVLVANPTLPANTAKEVVALAKARGHAASQLSVKPSMANLVLWRSLYVYDGRVQADAFHLGLATRHYPGESAQLLDAEGARRVAAGDAGRLRDIERFRVFSDGFLVLDKTRPGFVGDARYAMQPTAIAPIWGLEWRASGAATEFVSRHDFSPAMRRDFLAMLQGRDKLNP